MVLETLDHVSFSKTAFPEFPHDSELLVHAVADTLGGFDDHLLGEEVFFEVQGTGNGRI